MEFKWGLQYTNELVSTRKACLPRNIPDLITHKLVSILIKIKRVFLGPDSNLPAFEEIFWPAAYYIIQVANA